MACVEIQEVLKKFSLNMKYLFYSIKYYEVCIFVFLKTFGNIKINKIDQTSTSLEIIGMKEL